MYKIIIKDLNNNQIGSFEKSTIEEVNSYLALIEAKARPWHLPKAGEYDQLPVGALTYTIETRTDEFGNVKTVYVLTKQYTEEIIDLTQDYDYLLQECYRKRKAEYPSIEDFVDAKVKQSSSDVAIREQGLVQEQDYLSKCLAVKIKYPKP